MFKLSQNSKKHREGVDPRLIEVSDRAIEITLVDFGHDRFGGLRTPELQNELYRNGKSQRDGYNIKSYHQTGKALDFYAYVDGKVSYYQPHLAMVACSFFQAASDLNYRISWGGLWRSKNPITINSIPYGWDCPHIQLEE